MGEQIRNVWNRSAVPFYIAIAVVLAMGCGYSISASQNRQSMVDLAQQQIKERASIQRAHRKEVRLMQDRNTFLVNQIASLARQSSDATTAAVKGQADK